MLLTPDWRALRMVPNLTTSQMHLEISMLRQEQDQTLLLAQASL